MINNKRQILHIDMNSYFATVEQQANPSLRGKPIGIKGSAAKRTIVAAASIEAKKFGVKTGMRVDEALDLCPELILVVGEPTKYSSVTKQFIEIFERYTDRVEIFSIDEAFLDVTKTAHLYVSKIKNSKKRLDSRRCENDREGNVILTRNEEESQRNLSPMKGFGMIEQGAIEIARRIKADIRCEIGEWITCSVGVAPNKFLAKLGSNLEKPDGLVVITEDNKEEILVKCKLTDFCGIASRIEERLNRMGIYSVKDLREADDLVLKKEFGTYGLKIKRMSLGLDISEVLDWHKQADAKSFGHSRTLNKDVTNMTEIKGQLYLLSEKVAKRMRDEKYFGKEVGVWIRFKDFSGVSKRHRINYWINDGHDIHNVACGILEEIYFGDIVASSVVAKNDDKNNCVILGQEAEESRKIKRKKRSLEFPGVVRGGKKPIRAMGVYVTRISKNVPQYLFKEDKKKEHIVQIMDDINNRFGEDTIFKGVLLNFPFKKIVSGLGRKKF